MQTSLPIEPASPPVSVQLHHGDCLDVMPALPVESVQMVFADLPYSHATTSGVRKCTENLWDIPFDADALWVMLDKLLADTSPVIMTATQPFAALLISKRLKMFRYDIIWQKSRPTGFLNAKKMPLRAHESILLFCNKSPSYNPQMRKNCAPRGPIKRLGNLNNWGNKKTTISQANTGTHYPISVLQINTETRTQNKRHPTQKPVALLEWLIKTYTNPGDTVLDPVFGSCTTGIACLRTGRRFIGIEKDAGYFEIGRKRMADEQARLGHPVTV